MVLIYGEPTVGNGYSTHEISWGQCYSMCYWDANCSLSYYYSSQCSLYQYGNYSIKQLTSSDEKLIAFKRNFTTDTCPSKTVQIVGTDSYDDNGTVYINRITSDGIFWNITYSSTSQCDNETKLFRRDNYWVCVGVQLFPKCSRYADALKACNESDWETITGPYSKAEMGYFWSLRKNLYNWKDPFLWLDGKFGQFADKTLNGYKLALLQYSSIGRHCPYTGHSDAIGLVSVTECENTDNGSNCWSGAACLAKYVDVS